MRIFFKTSERFSRSWTELGWYFFLLLSNLKQFADSELVDMVICILKLLVNQVKFGLSEKRTKFEKIFLMVLTNQLKTMWKIFSNSNSKRPNFNNIQNDYFECLTKILLVFV